MGFDVVVGVEPVVIDGGGNVGGCVKHIGVGRTGEGSVVDIEGDHVGGCPSSIGVRGWWGSGVGSVVAVEGVDVVTCGSYCGIGSCRTSRRRNMWELLWYWEGCGGRCRVGGRCQRGGRWSLCEQH